ncbi:hypothetical protein DFJ74DRAFT_653754 [Hyaloraphidium curvatum]|nr:hypothetical protein DFJ74DRAFT_653754 [Hyaloraphidium curvatum]
MSACAFAVQRATGSPAGDRRKLGLRGLDDVLGRGHRGRDHVELGSDDRGCQRHRDDGEGREDDFGRDRDDGSQDLRAGHRAEGDRSDGDGRERRDGRGDLHGQSRRADASREAGGSDGRKDRRGNGDLDRDDRRDRDGLRHGDRHRGRHGHGLVLLDLHGLRDGDVLHAGRRNRDGRDGAGLGDQRAGRGHHGGGRSDRRRPGLNDTSRLRCSEGARGQAQSRKQSRQELHR